MARFWLRVFPLVRSELRGWRDLAASIPDPVLRAQAVETLRSERLSAAGAALFAATTARHDAGLVRTLVAYQAICDYLDTLAEQPSTDPIANGAQLHRALADAVAVGRAQEDYYRLHAIRDDGGYLAALVEACRSGCAALPGYTAVRDAALREARRNEVQGINHGPAELRESALRAWAGPQQREAGDARWFEIAAAGSSSLAVLALLAAAADPRTSPASAERTRAAYFPWIEALSTLLDSLADCEHDVLTGELSFVGFYDSPAAASARLATVSARAIAAARSLPRGERQAVLVAGMIAMHLSESSAWTPATKPIATAVVRAADHAVMSFLLTLLRRWRSLNDRCDAAAVLDAKCCVKECFN